MKIVAYILAAVLLLFGFIFVTGAQGRIGTMVTGIILMAGAVALVIAMRLQPTKEEITHVQKIDLTGDVQLEQMKCSSCGGALSKEHLEVHGGAIFVDCPYCGASYQIEEAPKW